MRFRYRMVFSLVLYSLCIQSSIAGLAKPLLIKTGGLFGQLSFSPDSKYLALSGNYLPGNNGGTILFDIPSWRVIDIKNYANALGKIEDAEPIAWSPDALNLFISTDDTDIAIFDVKSRDIRTVWNTPFPYKITALVPVTNEIIAVLECGIDYYDVKNGKKIQESAKPNPTDCDDNILARIDGDLVYSASNPDVIRRRNIKSGKTTESKELPGGVITLAVSGNQKEIAVTYLDQSKSPNGYNSTYIQLLNASDLSPIGDEIFVDYIHNIDRILFDHDDQSLILLLDLPFTNPVAKEEEYDTLVKRFDLKSQQFSDVWKPIRTQPVDIAESNDGRYLACSTTDGIYIADFNGNK